MAPRDVTSDGQDPSGLFRGTDSVIRLSRGLGLEQSVVAGAWVAPTALQFRCLESHSPTHPKHVAGRLGLTMLLSRLSPSFSLTGSISQDL